MKLENHFLRGSYPPLITPFTEDGTVDYDAYGELVDFQIRSGSHGVTTGTVTLAAQKLNLLHVDVVEEPGLAALGLVTPALQTVTVRDHTDTRFKLRVGKCLDTVILS